MATMTKSEKGLTRLQYLVQKYVNLEKWMSSEDELDTIPRILDDGDESFDKVNVQDFFQIVLADPTIRLNGSNSAESLMHPDSKVKVGEYSEWLIKQFLNLKLTFDGGLLFNNRRFLMRRIRFLEDLYKVKEDLTKFHRFKNRLTKDNRDINKLTIEGLEFLMSEYSLEKTKASAEEKDAAKSSYSYPGSKIVFKGIDWTVVKISELTELAKDAACFFGGYDLKPIQGETSWCTSSPGTYNRYNYHAEKGPLYVVLPNQCDKFGKKTGLPSVRYQFHFQTNQFMDANDKQIALVDFLEDSMRELKDFFKPEFAAGLVENGGEELSIDDFENGSVGKYIRLYGLDDLFDTLPDTLTKIHVKNTRADVSLSLPTSITRFKNLTSIYFRNCLAEIPEEICSLENLVFIALEGNKNLKHIPEKIIDLPKLLFLNLKDCSNLTLTDYFKSRSVEFGPDLWKGKAMS